MYKADKMQLKNKLQLGTFFMSMFMLTACGGGGSSTAPNQPATSQSLAGSWSTLCQASTSLAGYNEMQIFNFKGNKLTTHNIFFTRNADQPQTCKHSDEALCEEIQSDFVLGETINSCMPTERTKINITSTKVMLDPLNSSVTALLNNANRTGNEPIHFGYGRNWQLEVWQDISSIDAARTNFKIDIPDPDILQISILPLTDSKIDVASRKVLKLGVKMGNVDSDGRPISLDNSIIAFLQKKTTTPTWQTP
jgi:hypothetical protein